ncbi:hypothetical protein ACDQ55_17380 [Chitinophaga sp. 30R24]|uniref:hypothetical protein n=1 Tax=Chitinophaga sp. 30R24 TaxID=3248838 RepID=UPI003B916B05
MNNEIAQIIEEEICSMSVDLNNKLSETTDIYFREERHLEENRKEYIFELMVIEFENEDDYGPSLTIRLEKLNDYYELDLSVIRSYGSLLDRRLLKFTEQTVRDVSIHAAFFEMGSALLMALEKLYLNRLR